MSMTTKHFELLAATLRCQYSAYQINDAHSLEPEADEAWSNGFDGAMIAVVSVCKTADPRFDERKFREAVYQTN